MTVGRVGVATSAPLPTAATDATAATESGAPEAKQGTDGIVINDHPVARNFLRWGGIIAGVGGGALAGAKLMNLGGATLSGVTNLAPIAGAVAAVGLLGFGLSFLGGLQPKSVPFLAKDLPTLDAAQQKAVEHGDDVAVYKQGEGAFALVDFAPRDFDNEPVGNIDLGNQKIAWEGLITQDGDLLKQVNGDEFQNIGVAWPDALKLSDLKTAADVSKLAGVQLGTTGMHTEAKLGAVTGDPAGYPTYADAAQAAYDATGTTGIVKLGDRHYLVGVTVPSGANVELLKARGTGITPVSGMQVQEGKLVFRAGAPGSAFTAVGRAIPFDTAEPVGFRTGSTPIGSLIRSGTDARAAAQTIVNDHTLARAVLGGSNRGVVIIDGTNPNGTHTVGTYDVSGSGSKGAWDSRLGRPAGILQREVSTWRDEQTTYWNDENNATMYYTDYRRDSAVLRGSQLGDLELETTGTFETDSGIDWGASQSRRNSLRAARLEAERQAREAAERAAEAERRRREEEQNQTSPGDDGGSTSPGDDVGSGGSTSPGDDVGSGGSTSPGDDYSSGGSTSPGDDYDSGSGSSGSDDSSGYDNPSWDDSSSGSSSGDDDSSGYDNPDFE